MKQSGFKSFSNKCHLLFDVISLILIKKFFILYFDQNTQNFDTKDLRRLRISHIDFDNP